MRGEKEVTRRDEGRNDRVWPWTGYVGWMGGRSPRQLLGCESPKCLGTWQELCLKAKGKFRAGESLGGKIPSSILGLVIFRCLQDIIDEGQPFESDSLR